MATTPTGWYPDPADPRRARYWDGQQWTDRTQPLPAAVAPQPPTPPRHEAPDASGRAPLTAARPGLPDDPSSPLPRRGSRWTVGIAAVAVILVAVVAVVALMRPVGLGQPEPSSSAGLADTEDPDTEASAQDVVEPSETADEPDAVDDGTGGSPATGEGREAVAPLTVLHAAYALDVFGDLLDDFTDATGIGVVSEEVDDLRWVLASGVPSEVDVGILYAEEFGAALASGQTVPLDQVVPIEELASTLLPGLLDATTHAGAVHGLPISVEAKSLVWYAPAAFADGGYSVPETWEELLDLTQQMLADGRTPWCVGIESGPATGWVVTDWIEDALLNLHGGEVYDAWVAHELAFDSDEVRTAIDGYVAPILFTPGSVAGGSDAMLATSFIDSASGVLAGDCLMHRQAAFVQHFLPMQARIGEDIEVFAMPPIAAGFAAHAQLLSGDLVVVFEPSPQATAFIRYLGTQRAGEIWARSGVGVSAVRTVPPEAYLLPIDARAAELLASVTIFRYDGSDRMPPEIGADVFWREAAAWVSRDGRDLDGMLRRIDAGWP